MSDRYGDQGPTPLVETGWTVVNAELGARWSNSSSSADLLNVGDVHGARASSRSTRRLPLEGPNPPAGISFTPGFPRTFMTWAAVYW